MSMTVAELQTHLKTAQAAVNSARTTLAVPMSNDLLDKWCGPTGRATRLVATDTLHVLYQLVNQAHSHLFAFEVVCAEHGCSMPELDTAESNLSKAKGKLTKMLPMWRSLNYNLEKPTTATRKELSEFVVKLGALDVLLDCVSKDLVSVDHKFPAHVPLVQHNMTA